MEAAKFRLYMTSESPYMHKPNNLFPAIRFNLVAYLILLFIIVDSENSCTICYKIGDFNGVSKFTVS